MCHLLEVYDIVTELYILSQLVNKLGLDLRIGLDRYCAGARYYRLQLHRYQYHTGNDVAYSLGHAYVTHVVHSVRTIQKT